MMRASAYRTRPVQRQYSGDIFEAVGRHSAEQIPHRSPIELEHSYGVPLGQQRVGLRIVGFHSIQVRRLLAIKCDVAHGVVNDGEIAQPQEVHLEQPERFAGRHVELRDNRSIRSPAVNRDNVDQRHAGHDHAGRVHAPLPLEPL
jgi:hypothetical protein